MFQHTAARRRLVVAGVPVWVGAVSTHSRPKAAENPTATLSKICRVSTHSRPKAAAILRGVVELETGVSTHSRPKAADHLACGIAHKVIVSTHSRPKAAASNWRRISIRIRSFNTQPPEGGCILTGIAVM